MVHSFNQYIFTLFLFSIFGILLLMQTPQAKSYKGWKQPANRGKNGNKWGLLKKGNFQPQPSPQSWFPQKPSSFVNPGQRFVPPELRNKGSVPPGLRNKGSVPPGLRNKGFVPPGLRGRLLSGRWYGVQVTRMLEDVVRIRQKQFGTGRFKGFNRDDSKLEPKIKETIIKPKINPGEEKEDPKIPEHIRKMMENAKIVEEEEEEEEGRRKRDASAQVKVYPRVMGVNLGELPQLNPRGKMRPGTVSNTHSCNHVRAVPDNLHMIIPPHYTRYTEAYRIPIVGSKFVTDEGLKRACYIVRVMFADRFDIRLAFFQFDAKIAVIADNESTTDLPEYKSFDSAHYDSSTRGLGATLHIPMSSAGDDNMRCCCNDRYPDEDIMAHEVAHGVHQVAANYVVRGFNKRLEYCYTNATSVGKWYNTYAGKNKEEYWAMGTAFYFNSYHRNDYKFGDVTITGRDSLKTYDKCLYDLLYEIHPCKNDIVQRCDWRREDGCTPDNVTLMADYHHRQKSRCGVKQTIENVTMEECRSLACYHLAYGFTMLDDTCKILNCPSPADLKITPVGGTGKAYQIYKVDRQPVMDLKREEAQVLKMDCTAHTRRSRCNIYRAHEKPVEYGPSLKNRTECKNAGGCFSNNTCHYPIQDCFDTSYLCPDAAVKGECERNPAWMWMHCALSCSSCKKLRHLDHRILISMCRDASMFCPAWGKRGECNNPLTTTYMYRTCALTCGLCNAQDPLVVAAIQPSIAFQTEHIEPVEHIEVIAYVP